MLTLSVSNKLLVAVELRETLVPAVANSYICRRIGRRVRSRRAWCAPRGATSRSAMNLPHCCKLQVSQHNGRTFEKRLPSLYPKESHCNRSVSVSLLRASNNNSHLDSRAGMHGKRGTFVTAPHVNTIKRHDKDCAVARVSSLMYYYPQLGPVWLWQVCLGVGLATV